MDFGERERTSCDVGDGGEGCERVGGAVGSGGNRTAREQAAAWLEEHAEDMASAGTGEKGEVASERVKGKETTSLLADLDVTGVVARKVKRGYSGSGYTQGLSVVDIAGEQPALKQPESKEKEEGEGGNPSASHHVASFSESGPIYEHTDEPPSFTEQGPKYSSPTEDAPKDPKYEPPDSSFLTDEDVLDLTGPRGWTLTIFAALSTAAGANITWHNLTGMREPRLFGDILVLPIGRFATGIPHSGSALEGSPDACVRHGFIGS